jgi:UDP-GlcNAc:undecaprenyl-phosphate/decaprenyl-phosphate GlcNAc-1-phosphate transferase
MLYFFALILAFYATVTITPLIRRAALRLGMVDVPNERKVHVSPVPRAGGVAMAVGIIVPMLVWVPMDTRFKAFIAGMIIIFIFGLLDDLYELDYKKKFLGQILAVAVTMITGRFWITNLGMWNGAEVVIPPALGIPLTAFFILGVTNAINLADGLDGLAGGMCILTFACISFLAFRQEETSIALASLIMIGAILGFLRYNTFPANIFLGDTGSQLLGFSAALLSLYLTQSEHSPFARTLPLLIIGLPIMDTLTVMVRRIMRGRSPFKPDKTHFHHQMMEMGASHVGSVALIYLLQSLMVFLAFYLEYYTAGDVFITFIIIFSGILLFFYIGKNYNISMYKALAWGKDWTETLGSSRLANVSKDWLLRALQFVLAAGLTILAVSSTPKFRGWELLLFFIIIVCMFIFRKLSRTVFNNLVRYSIYLIGIYLLFSMQNETLIFFDMPVRLFNYIFWGTMAAILVIYLVITKFRELEISSLDYLLMLLVVIITFLPFEQIDQYQLPMVTIAMIILLWSSEVILQNKTSTWNILSTISVVNMFIIGGKAILN